MSGTPVEIVVSTGDPRGIGPEVSIKAARRFCEEHADADVVLAGDPDCLAEAGLAGRSGQGNCGRLRLLEVPRVLGPAGRSPVEAGGDCAFAILEAATRYVAGDPRRRALVTAPVSKLAIHREGRPFHGHTGWLAQRLGVERAVMLFAAPAFKLALATVHVPLRDVPRVLTRAHLVSTLTVLVSGLRELYGAERPSIAVLGLNPHAGEGGLLGAEEREVIGPAMEEAGGSTGAAFHGPCSADTFFTGGRHGEFDAVVAMYHDQGLIPVKTLAFGRAVNVTLGLPIVRTSVDHGCAFEIAGLDRADPSSMLAAIRHAASLLPSRV